MFKWATMYVQISNRPAVEGPRGALDMLLDCHGRIRRFSALSTRLATTQAPAAELREAAAQVHRYFTVALPLHVADEDGSLRTHVLSTSPAQALVDALNTMTREHVELEALLAECAPQWKAIELEPARQADVGPSLAARSTRLEELFRIHLLGEEETLFPLLRQHLSPELDATLVGEFRARRETR